MYDTAPPQKREQGRLFGALGTALAEAGGPNIDGKRETLQKRLERARLFRWH